MAFWAANSPEWFFAQFGAALAGLALVTVNPAYRAAELAYVLKQSRACGILMQDQFRGRDLRAAVATTRTTLPALREVIPLSTWTEFAASGAREGALPKVLPGDAAQIQYTSGTTCAPKGARLTDRNSRQQRPLLGPSNRGAGNGRLGEPDADVPHRWLWALHSWRSPDGRVAGDAAGFRSGADLDLLEQERSSIVLSVPTMLQRVLDAPSIGAREISSWRLVSLGGAPVPPELIKRAEQRGVQTVIGFGQTEASPYLTHTVPNDPHPDWANTVGRPLPQTEIKIVSLTRARSSRAEKSVKSALAATES